jgi:leader peptidase (prepilin peptidase) / N-methyltransferase
MEAAAFAGLMGAIAGSFLNVVAYRLPRRESVVWPGSHCPHCGAAVRSRDNVPIVSYVLLRGRCRSCSAAISRRYPLVEALTAALCVGAVLAHPSGVRLVLGILTVLVLVPAALIDVEHRIIPNRLTAAGSLLALAAGTVLDPAGEPQRLIAGAAAGGLLLVAALAYPGGMGMGDVKLAGVMGLLLGRGVAAALLVAVLAGVLLGMLVIARKGAREGRKTAIPFGPFLALGGLSAIFAGEQLVDLYLHHLA